jgi:hypothetical protein
MRYATFRSAQPDTTDESSRSGSLSSSRRRRGDAWLLDAADKLAAQLARDGDPEPVAITETDATFTIDWKGSYRIEGATFIYSDRKRGGMRAILGYPAQKLEHAARGS